MEPVQGEGDVSEVFLVLGPLEEALEHRPRVPCERRALGVGQPEVDVAPAFGPHASGTALKKNDDPMTNVTLQAMAVACITYSLQWPCLLPTGSLANQAQ